MTGIAILSTSVFVAFGVAALNGTMPLLRLRRATRSAPSPLQVRIDAAAVSWSRWQIIGASAGLAVLVAVIVASLTPIWMLAAVPALLAAAAPFVWLSRTARARTRAIRAAWPDALAQIGGSLRTGRPLSHAMIDLSLGGPPALAEPFEGLAARIQTVGLVPALEAARDAIAEPLTDRIIEVLTLAHVEGGRIVLEIIEDLSRAVEDEIVVAEETETLALEGKLNARLVFALPWIVLVVLTARSGPFQAFYSTGAGAVVIAVGMLMSGIGLAVASRLSAIPEPVRVLVPDRSRR